MPASYPTAAKSFTVKNTGDIIQAADVDDLQDEVTAIEQTLITGPITLPAVTAASAVVTGASSLASLHVTGGSTFAGSFTSSNSTVNNLNVVGGSTLASLTVTSSNTTLKELFVTVPPPSVRAFNSVKFDVANNARAAVTLNSDRYVNPTSMHSTGSNPSRLIAPSSGVYLITGHVTWALASTSAGGLAALEVQLNGATLIAQQYNPTITNSISQSVATVYNLSAADYVEMTVIQITGSTASLSVSGNTSPEFTLTKLR